MQEQTTRESLFGIVFNEERSEVLLIKRRDIPVWVLPGGGRDAGEDPETGALREVLEETGYRVKAIRKVAEYSPVNRMTLLTHTFECRITGGEPLTGAETREVKFFPVAELPQMAPPFKGWIHDAHAHYPYLLKKKIEGVTYWVLARLLLEHPLLVGRYLLTKLGIHINRWD